MERNWVGSTLAIAMLLISTFTYAHESRLYKVDTDKEDTKNIDFKVSPNRCVTLRQGQPCYVRVRFNWRSNKALAVCLYNLEGTKITCWKSSETGSIVLSQTLPKTTEYILVDTDGVELNRASVAVSWVYQKKRSRRRWRLF